MKNLSYHPAFSSNRPTSGATDILFEELFEDIDAGLDQAMAVARLHKLIHEISSDIVPDFLPFLKLGCEKAVLRFFKEKGLRSLRGTKTDHSSEIKAKADLIDKNGTLRMSVPKRIMQELTEMLDSDIEDLRIKSKKKPDFVLTNNIHAPEPNKLMQSFCRDNHVFKILSCLYGIEFERIGFSLHFSYPGETWYGLFDDLEIPTPRTAQMHYDMEYAIPKAMLYLNDVGLEQGPFGYCAESNDCQITGFRLCLSKEVISSLNDFVQALGKLDLGQPLFRSSLARRIFASLPPPMQLTAMPGDFVIDGTSTSETLLGTEKFVTGPAGSFTLFTGSHMLHRGGLVQDGERLVLQFCFWPKDETHYKPAVTWPPRKGRFFSNEDFSRKLVNISPQRDVTALDIGGAVEMQPHWLRLPKIAKTYVFEPHAESFLALLERQKIDPTYLYNHYLMIALGGENGNRTLYKANEPTGSSLLPPHPNGINNYPESEYLYPMEEETIEVQTLASALAPFKLSHVDAIKLDTQGTELEILKSLGPDLSKDLLLVEMEIPVIENYVGNPTNLPEVIEYAESLGLDLFDMRCNRFPGNAIRKGVDFAPASLDAEWGLPSMGERLNEVDAVFFKDPRKLIDENGSPQKLKRLISLLAIYYFFPEAVFAADYAHAKGLLPDDEKISILDTLRELHGMARQQTRIYEKHLKERNGLNWGQYMHTPSPST